MVNCVLVNYRLVTMLLLCCLCLQLTEQRALPQTSKKTKKGTANNATRSNSEQQEVKTSRRETSLRLEWL